MKMVDAFYNQSCLTPSKHIHCMDIEVTDCHDIMVSDNRYTKSALLLSQNNTACWITLTILFIFISSNLILYHLEQLVHFHKGYKKTMEIIDFTNEEEYRVFQAEEFQVRYGSRALVHQVKPYKLYKDFHEKIKARNLSI